MRFCKSPIPPQIEVEDIQQNLSALATIHFPCLAFLILWVYRRSLFRPNEINVSTSVTQKPEEEWKFLPWDPISYRREENDSPGFVRRGIELKNKCELHLLTIMG